MTDPRPPRVPRRELPGVARYLSSITVSVDPPAVAPPEADARTVELLRKARDRGVTTFDVGDARFPQRAERLVATAFPAAEPDLGVIVTRSIDSLAQERSPRGDPLLAQDLPGALEESLEQSRRRLAPVRLSILEWDPTRADRSSAAPETKALPLSLAGTKDLQWAFRLSPRTLTLPDVGSSPPVFSGELSLLDPAVNALFEAKDRHVDAHLIARNPFSDGRLDGSRFEAATMLKGPGTGPVDLRRLQAEFDPVLALGFLTVAHRRTLAQAALRYVLAWPWVATVAVPLPTPERFEEILGFEASAPLSEEEQKRLGLVK